ncbi:MAG: RAMP superfamily CRISPR-associated protein [Melioribacteraceae bacterium]
MLKLIFTTLTPLHISNGEQLGYGLDYIQRGNYIYKLNPLKVAQKLAQKKAFDFTKNYSLDDLIDIIKKYENLFTDEDAFYVVEVDRAFSQYIANERAKGRKYFNEFINSNGKFYVPASSIKGAILTVLKTDHLGIDIKEADINDKFVMHDSEFIDSDKMKVYLTNNRPPKMGLLCIAPNTTFSFLVSKYKSLNVTELKKNLKAYSSKQVDLARNRIRKYRASQGRKLNGADIFDEALQNLEKDLNNLKDEEFLINIGFGGGSWFKVLEDTIPRFKSKSPKKDRIGKMEEPHTSITFNFNGRIDHIGWCKLRIEEE